MPKKLSVTKELSRYVTAFVVKVSVVVTKIELTCCVVFVVVVVLVVDVVDGVVVVVVGLMVVLVVVVVVVAVVVVVVVDEIVMIVVFDTVAGFVVVEIDGFVCTSEVILVMAAVELGDDMSFTLAKVGFVGSGLPPIFDGDFDFASKPWIVCLTFELILSFLLPPFATFACVKIRIKSKDLHNGLILIASLLWIDYIKLQNDTFFWPIFAVNFHATHHQ